MNRRFSGDDWKELKDAEFIDGERRNMIKFQQMETAENEMKGGAGMCKLAALGSGSMVAEIKLPYIEHIVSLASECKHISRIMLFGSSTEERCTDLSDIDIAVFGDLSKGKYYASKEYRDFVDRIFEFDFSQDYDILYFKEGSKQQAPILDDVSRGVEIYRRATA